MILKCEHNNTEIYVETNFNSVINISLHARLLSHNLQEHSNELFLRVHMVKLAVN